MCLFKVHNNILAKCEKQLIFFSEIFYGESIFKRNVWENVQPYVFCHQKLYKHITYKNIIKNIYRKALKLNILN